MAGSDGFVDIKKIGKLLRDLNGHSCAFYAEIHNNGKTTFDQGAIELLANDEQKTIDINTLFAYGSFQKTLFINLALDKIMTGQLVNNVEKRMCVMNAWDRPALTVLNELRRADGDGPLSVPTKPTPTILEVLTHIDAFFYDHKHLFGPDGAVLMCEKTLAELLRQADEAEQPRQRGCYHYSNFNHIIAAMIVCRATDMSLSDALQELVLKNEQGVLGLKKTIISEQMLKDNEYPIAEPYVITQNGTFQATRRDYFRDDLELAVGGGYSCVRDIAKLLRFYMEALSSKDTVITDRLLSSEVNLKIAGVDCQSSLTGLRIPLNSRAVTSESIEGAFQRSYYDLGKKHGENVDAILKAGTVRGYSSHYFILPRARLFLVVMTNSSGVVDPSLHISLYVLKELLNIRSSADIQAQAPQILVTQRSIATSRTASLSLALDFDASEVTELEASYIDSRISMRMDIVILSGTNKLGVRLANYLSPSKCTSVMRLVKIAEGTLAVVPEPAETAIDLYVTWPDFVLRFEKIAGSITSLRRLPVTPGMQGLEGVASGQDWVFKRV